MAAVGRRMLSVGLCCLICGLILWYASAPLRKACVGESQTAPDVQALEEALYASPAPQEEASTGQPLFAELDSDDIQSVSIQTKRRVFQFQCSTDDSVSVNAYVADEDVFDTLLEQLMAFSFEPCDPFEPEGDPLLTVEISAGAQQYSAWFYEDGGTGKNTNIICTQQGDTQYLTTEAWRVGTLLLTCEGTRIFDESGKETPAGEETSSQAQ